MLLSAVAHHTKGRLRLKFPGIKGKPALAEQIRAVIMKLPGVTRAEANPLTGSVIIHHKNPDQYAFVMLLARHGEERRMFLLEVPAGGLAGTARTPKQQITLRDLAGHSLMALGVAGVLLPVIPGTPFILAGAAVLGPDHPLVSRVRSWLRVIH